MHIQMTEPSIEAGILFSPRISFCLNGLFRSSTGETYTGKYTLFKSGNEYILQDASQQTKINLPWILTPEKPETDDFELTDVVIGIHFHWERKENQRFRGILKFIDEGEHLTAINRLPLEEYLLSVISSEMSATSSLQFLQAHAVISRSWLLAQKMKKKTLKGNYSSEKISDQEYIRWYDREDHAHFDVCADDHCQRYQGITKACTPIVREAVGNTRGEVLTCQGEICDARFSKCCGGITERFENTWEDVSHPYLSSVYDYSSPGDYGDLSREENARRWILSSPPAFCHTEDRQILSEVLNDYDQETMHFFRWKVTYTPAELRALILKKTGIDFGNIHNLIPVKRGDSGRIILLRIEGSLNTRVIGKELTIRSALSDTHLYSSAFIVEKQSGQFILHGAGWGHGVGLCQIGAAVMGAKGYAYREILQHYFQGSGISKLY